MKTAKLCSLVFLALVLVLSVGPARATITLTDSNSTALIDTSSPAGMYSWTVDGISQLYQQWFWYRIGSTGGEQPVNTLGLTSSSQLGPGEVALNYGTTGGLTIQLDYLLIGGPAHSGQSDISETIKIVNTSSSSMALHFFQYSDFDLDGTPYGQTVNITNGNEAEQTSLHGSLSETVVTGNPNRYEANVYANTLTSLSDGSPTLLNNNATSSGDVTWAFQWDRTLAPGGSVIISKDKNLAVFVPEPATVLGLGVILLAVGRKLRTRLGA